MSSAISAMVTPFDSPGLTPTPGSLGDKSSRDPLDAAGAGLIDGTEQQIHDGNVGELDDEDEDDIEMDEVSGAGDEYEQERAENIRHNAELLASLGLNGTQPIRPHQSASTRAAIIRSEKKPNISSAERRARRETRARTAALKRDVAPTRRSGRVAALSVKAEDGDEKPSTVRIISVPQVKYDPIPKASAPVLASGPEYEDESPGKIFYPSQSRPTRKSDGTLIFEGRWKCVFTPNITPEEMFKGGAFGGAFFCDTYSQSLKKPLSSSSDIAQLPFSLGPSVASTHLAASSPDPEINRFRTRAGQSLQEWEKAGWIWSEDPRGWAQWYVRFWNGRRCVDDERQVKRWLKVAGPTGRFKRALLKKVHQSGGKMAIENEDVGRVVRQTLWQWGYELTLSEYERAMKGE